MADAQSGALFDAGGERDERAAQAELLERAGSQATRDLAHFLDAPARGELYLRDIVVELGRDAAREAVELQPDAGEDLPEFVVKLTGEAASLAFLGGEGAAAAGEPFALEAVEHVVEGVGEIGHFGYGPLDRDAAAWLGGLDATHEGSQVLERLEHAPEQRDVDAGDDDDANAEHDELGDRERRADRRRREDEGEGGGQQQAGVDGDDAPEQRHGGQHRAAPGWDPWVALPNCRWDLSVGWRAMTLLWRVFATNAAVLVVATLILVLTPITVSFPIALTEIFVVAAGLAVMLVLDLLLLRRAFAPLGRLTAFMRRVDPLRPGERAELEAADPEVRELTGAFNDMIERVETERRDSARRALAAQEDERARIARELHDEIGQALTAVVLQLERAARRTDPPVRGEVEEAREAVRASLEEVREIARRLRPEALDDLGLASALAALTLDVSRRTGLRIERRIAPGLPALSPEEELVVYRVAQEGLTNVARHAGAEHAWIALEGRDGGVALEVRDDGHGFAHSVEGAGLRGMRERALLVGADLAVEPGHGTGTVVRLKLRSAGA